MRKIGLFNIGKLGLVKSAGTGKTDINKVIEKWIPKHMVFWYDMSKPVDTYIPGVTYANPFINGGGKLTHDKTINKCIITHTPTNNNNIAFWQIIVKPLQYVESYKIRVTGLPTGFTIKGRIGYDNIQITSDGEYDIPEHKNSSTTNTSYPGFYLAGDNVNDVDCNIVVEEIPTKQSVPTNEILKANPYLQDFSGNNRPLKLNNFLFAAMSGVGGYEMNYTDSALFITYLSGVRGDGTITDNTITINNVKVSSGVIETRVSSPSKKYKVRVTGITSNETLRYVVYGDTSLGELATIIFDMKKDGEYELPASTYSATYNMKWQVIAASYPHTCNITIEQISSYPNALVTDGVDDYGQVQNLQQGVKVLFYTCNNFRLSQILYDQRKVGYDKIQSSYFSIFTEANTIAYNAHNVDGKTYIDGVLNETTIADNLLGKKTIITIINSSANSERTGKPSFFSTYNNLGYFANLAFYNSIGFDSVPTKQNDGFTEQDLIDYYIPKAIVTITVVDVSGSPIQDATVTVGGVQYKTLSDGTVKVRGMANGTMSLSVKKDGYMPFSDNSWKLADSRITLEVLRNTVITENGYSILLENDGLILTE
uniref:Carboxypeptidase regulatory-like domain protein n=1 Tax=Myoviridae sp. ct04y17 TaxID=2827652 RepID=A0A8S5SJ24_9CAUD|nr:MAG TPA: Carboxypeptidase regulatory-like domain protein [Myoviridae sp. ct04y17]